MIKVKSEFDSVRDDNIRGHGCDRYCRCDWCYCSYCNNKNIECICFDGAFNVFLYDDEESK